MQASHCSSLGLNPGQITWNLYWTKQHWSKFSPSTSVSLVNSHSTDSSTIYQVDSVSPHPKKLEEEGGGGGEGDYELAISCSKHGEMRTA
jgi:hypothetical protein